MPPQPASAARTAFLFPGQGSQFVGMGRDLSGHAASERLLAMASDLSGQSLRQYCLEGPLDILSRTSVLQPALLAVSLGALALAREAGLEADMVAGHSLGEFTALCAGGVLSEEETVRLVCLRARLMDEAAAARPGVMVAVGNAPFAFVEEVVRDVAVAHPVGIANQNSPRQIVLSGDAAGVAAAESRLAARGARLTRLNVSGAWHSPLMNEAAGEFAAALARVEFRMPETQVFLNVSGQSCPDPEAIRAALAVQMIRPVLWTSLMEGMIAAGAARFYEIGPGKVLRGLLRHIWTDYDAYSVAGVDGTVALTSLRKQGAVAA